MPPPNSDDPTFHLRPSPETAVTADHAPAPPQQDGATVVYAPDESTWLGGAAPEGGAPPALIPGYEFLGVLGRGGMGVVYKARHAALKRTVALKMLLGGEYADPSAAARFRVEAEAVARLHHPNIVQIHEVGEAGGHPYCALEFVDGGSLAEKISGGPLPAGEAARLVETLARAVQLAHSRNVVHRDLKPANVLLAADGTPKVSDFGLARHLDADSGATHTGAVLGTPAYMAPEQAAGRSSEAGPAADIYALGVILYECVSGRPPFKGGSVIDTLDQVRTQEPAPPSRWRSGVPRDLETICLKCLRKEPEQRYASAAELADDLARCRNREPITARPVGRGERVVKWVRRNPAATAAAVAVVLSLALGTAVSYAKYRDAEWQKGVAVANEQAAQKETEKANRAREFLVSILALSNTDDLGGNITAKQILADAERRIPIEFADQPELRADLERSIGEVKRGIARRIPQAMILEATGGVTRHSAAGAEKPAIPQALVNLDDRITLAADARVRLVFLSDLHQEQLRPGRTVTIAVSGCQPADAVSECDGSVVMTFVPLKKGSFYRGWTAENKGVAALTTIDADFEIAVHAVTQGQWQAVMGTTPSAFSRTGERRNDLLNISDEELKLFPVESVSWHEAVAFIDKLNDRERGRGYVYRLPTEAEWEYACRCGATTEEECSSQFYTTGPTNQLSADLANYNGNFPYNGPKGRFLARPARVGSYPPNKLGLCDMHGNVSQWCAENADDRTVRFTRGGNWSMVGHGCSAGFGFPHISLTQDPGVGFRLARVRVP